MASGIQALAGPGEEADQEELLYEPRPRRGVRMGGAAAAAAAAAASAIGVVVLLGAGLHASGLLGGTGARLAAPLTVRALLASEEMTDVTTDNLLALHGDALASAGRSHVREQVARGLLRIDQALQLEDPEAHRQLSALELTGTEKEAAMRVVRKFGDARLVGISQAVAAAMDENARAAGDGEALQRRLSEALGPRFEDLVQLSAEMFPDRPVKLEEVDPSSALAAWHPTLEVDVGTAAAATRRRLAVLDGISGGVDAQARTLFESLEHELGGRMPSAPARMLQGSMTPGSSGTQQQNTVKFMDCLKAAVPNPAKVCSCIVQNMSHVMSMVMGFIKGSGQ